MAKGAMYWGHATGKLGQTVLSTVNGQQITRAYQPNVKNPKSNAQMLQRAKFATAVKFYKHATANFFPFAYEDKRKTESFYNAFMRHNTDVSMLTTRSAYNNNFYPALGNEYMLTQGRLQAIDIIRPTTVSDDSSTQTGNWQVDLKVHSTSETWGVVSQRWIDDGYLNGDIITLILITSTVSSIDDEPTAGLNWQLAQAVIDITSTETWSSGNVWSYRNNINLSLDEKAVESLRVQISPYNTNDDNKEYAAGFAAMVSRTTSSGVYVSDSYLINDFTANQIYQESLQDAFVQEALQTWGAITDTAVLKGAIAKKNL